VNIGKPDMEMACDAARTFFGLDTAVRCLLDGECSVRLVVLLLRTSRRMRRQVWSFFRQPERYCRDIHWLDTFVAQLWPYRERRQESKMFYNMYPCFVQASKESSVTQGFRVARVVTYALQSPDEHIVLRPGFFCPLRRG
jgi:hypothetical protein